MMTALVRNVQMDESLLKLLVHEIALTVSRGTASGPQDSRHDLGYGKSFNDKQRQRMSATSFPYTDPDPYEDLEYTEQEEEQSASVADKTYVPKTMDPGDPAKTDPFSFVGGNTTMAGGGGRSSINAGASRKRSFYFNDGCTKLLDCFNNIDKIMLEVESTGNSIAPLPGTWKNAPGGGGGSASYITLKTGKIGGTKKGWSKPHDKVAIEAENEESDGIMSIWDILKNQRLKKGLE